MMNYIWAGMILLSLIYGAITERIADVSAAALSGASDGVALAGSILGIMCLWSGLMGIARDAGLIQKVGKLLRPLTALLFPNIPQNSPAMDAIVANMTANMLGMANAATPLGLKAMQELKKLSPSMKNTASNDMCTFAIINTASIQLIPATMIALRQANGSLNAGEIVLPVILCSITAITVALTAERIITARRRRG